jgi:hypothetical protein
MENWEGIYDDPGIIPRLTQGTLILTPKVLWGVLEVNFNVRSSDCERNFCWFVVPFLWRM